jgi:biopolymer transport protein ExbD
MPKLEPMSNGASRGGRRGRGARVSTSLAEINVVPLVDVMLVLLVIFMVAAPMMQQGFPVNLPQSSQSRAIDAPVLVTVPITFRQDRRVQLDDEFVGFNVLAERVRQAVGQSERKQVMLAGDAGVTFGDLIMVFDRLREGGVENVALQTQPTTGQSTR